LNTARFDCIITEEQDPISEIVHKHSDNHHNGRHHIPDIRVS